MVDVNTIIGNPITTPDGTVIIPISKISYGFAAGGSDFAAKSSPAKDLFGGGSGAGVSITPVAFIAVCNGEVSLLNINDCNSGAAAQAINMAPDIIDKISGIFKKDKKKTNNDESKTMTSQDSETK